MTHKGQHERPETAYVTIWYDPSDCFRKGASIQADSFIATLIRGHFTNGTECELFKFTSVWVTKKIHVNYEPGIYVVKGRMLERR